MKNISDIIDRFCISGTIGSIRPLGDGLINDTYLASTAEHDTPDYVVQRINHHIFTDVDALQANIEAVTGHIRRKLSRQGTTDIDRRVLRFIPTKDSRKTYFFDGENYWRISVFIADAITVNEVSPHYARHAGRAFGEFQAMLTDIPETLVETIPDFHNMEFRLRQFREAIDADTARRVGQCRQLVDSLLSRADRFSAAEQLHREGKLQKRICHCDTKVNNMLFSIDGQVLCVIDLDTVMPSYIFSDFGDFLRTAACSAPEDEPDIAKIHFRIDIFEAFTQGYLQSAASFLTPLEIEMLPWGTQLFPYMQAVRFLTDYLNGDTYYKIVYPTHNLVRAQAQLRMLQATEDAEPQMKEIISRLYK